MRLRAPAAGCSGPGHLETSLQRRSILARGRDLWRALAPPRRSAMRLCPTQTPAQGAWHPLLADPWALPSATPSTSGNGH